MYHGQLGFPPQLTHQKRVFKLYNNSEFQSARTAIGNFINFVNIREADVGADITL